MQNWRATKRGPISNSFLIANPAVPVRKAKSRARKKTQKTPDDCKCNRKHHNRPREQRKAAPATDFPRDGGSVARIRCKREFSPERISRPMREPIRVPG